jgi:hypothetical protein
MTKPFLFGVLVFVLPLGALMVARYQYASHDQSAIVENPSESSLALAQSGETRPADEYKATAKLRLETGTNPYEIDEMRQHRIRAHGMLEEGVALPRMIDRIRDLDHGQAPFVR